MKYFSKILFICALGLFSGVTLHAQKFPNLAQTPPMGWNSWNKFAGNINEDLIRQTADAMATNGMKDAGYIYVNIDDCWQGERDAQGFIQPDPKHFPSGIKALADYVHEKGMKLGIYSDVGNLTCGGRPGSRGHEYQDALTYAKWGVDYLKYDWCNAEDLNAPGAYATMRDAIHTAGRPMVFSLCEWGQNKPWLWAADVGHLWRTTGDIYAAFDGLLEHGSWHQSGVLQIIDLQKPLRTYAGPGHWNDPDMLEVGNGLTDSENRAHFSMWCMLAAPLISGNDQRHMKTETLRVLTNKDVIAVDQDKLGIEGFVYSTNANIETWFKPLDNDEWAMCVLNRGQTSQPFSFDWKNEKVSDSFSKRDANFSATNYAFQNLWTGETGDTKEILSAEIPGHDVLMLRLRKADSTATTSADAQKIIRIKVGSPAPFTDADGNVWLADTGFADGEMNARADDLAISNTKNPALYRTERYGMTSFSYPLANGKYTVKLHFAETYEDLNTAGMRVFSFNVQGHDFKDFDVIVKAGGQFRAYIETVPVEISDGKLNLTFTPNVENPEINAIEIIPAS
jgi:alpha-galactosidase